MIIELVIKNDEEKIFTLDFPKVENGCEMPKKILLNYDEKTKRCESYLSYMSFNHDHKSTNNGWIQTYENNNLITGKSDELSVSCPSKNLDKDADLYTILDPEDFDHNIFKPVEEFINLDGFEGYCYHPDIDHRVYKKKYKDEGPIIIKVSKIPKSVKQFYYENIMKTNPPKNRDKNDTVFNHEMIKNDWMKTEIVKFQKHLKKRKVHYTKIDVKCLIEFIKLEKTFNNQYKSEALYSCAENKNFQFTTGVPDDWESYTLWGKDESLMMDIIHDEKYVYLNTDIKNTYDAWKGLNFYNIKFPCDEISRSYFKEELIKKLVRTPPGIPEKESTRILKINENFFEYLEMKPSTPGPGKIPNDPTNGDVFSKNNQKTFRYESDENWIDVMTFIPENVRSMENSNTPLLVYFGSGNGDYFHYYNGNKGRKEYFSHPNMEWYNKNCIIFSLDYFVPSGNKENSLSIQIKNY